MIDLFFALLGVRNLGAQHGSVGVDSLVWTNPGRLHLLPGLVDLGLPTRQLIRIILLALQRPFSGQPAGDLGDLRLAYAAPILLFLWAGHLPDLTKGGQG